jgi:hypothetical protein
MKRHTAAVEVTLSQLSASKIPRPNFVTTVVGYISYGY